jgi:hypothetical protein
MKKGRLSLRRSALRFTSAHRAFLRRYIFLLRLLAICVLTAGSTAHAEKYEFLSQRDFLAGAFPGTKPSAEKLTVTPALAERLAAIFRHRFREDRLRYWHSGNRSAWLLEEIGKEKPITIGVVVDNAQLVSIAVLVYREGHGMEVAEPAFTGVFPGAALVTRDNTTDMLDRDIDNITGSTLSVRAMTRTARAALVLDAWRREHGNPQP